MQNPRRNTRAANGVTTAPPLPYIGRFAPSPTGPLHLGSLFTALASFLEARHQQGLWLLRIDDLDTPRLVRGATEVILNTLDTFGLCWDKQVVYQSQHQSAYHHALQQLHTENLLYRCTCSRKSLAETALMNPSHEGFYPGLCRTKQQHPSSAYALRIKTNFRPISFQDALQGTVTENLATQYGDFVLQRKDRIIAYQLAVVIDDHLQGVNHVVRGADLLDSTAKQIYLHQCLNLPVPHYLHVPVITGTAGTKLSKRDFSPAVNPQNAPQILFKLLNLLQQNPPADLHSAPVRVQLEWAISHWRSSALQRIHYLPVT